MFDKNKDERVGEKAGEPEWFKELKEEPYERLPWVDHPSYNPDGNFFSEPYELRRGALESLMEFCEENNLSFKIGGWSSYYPERTLAIIISRKEAQPEEK